MPDGHENSTRRPREPVPIRRSSGRGTLPAPLAVQWTGPHAETNRTFPIPGTTCDPAERTAPGAIAYERCPDAARARTAAHLRLRRPAPPILRRFEIPESAV